MKGEVSMGNEMVATRTFQGNNNESFYFKHDAYLTWICVKNEGRTDLNFTTKYDDSDELFSFTVKPGEGIWERVKRFNTVSVMVSDGEYYGYVGYDSVGVSKERKVESYESVEGHGNKIVRLKEGPASFITIYNDGKTDMKVQLGQFSGGWHGDSYYFKEFIVKSDDIFTDRIDPFDLIKIEVDGPFRAYPSRFI